MTLKRASEDDLHLISKIQRVEHGVSTSPQPQLAGKDFSKSVKRKLADSKRTGQACDRCKIRKIRCDGRPEGCGHCELNGTPCTTTDRISGLPKVRGQAEAIEHENAYLRNQIADLCAQLKDVGVEPRAPPPYTIIQLPAAHGWPDSQRRTSSGTPTPAKPEYRSLPQFKHGSIGDNYLGVGAGDSPLSHIRGTSLSVFGAEIDITDYMKDESEYESSIMSYTSLLKETLGVENITPVPLPPYSTLKESAVWYLRSLNPYTMLVHKPAFMELIWKFGNDPSFKPTAPETVTVHMMLATIQYQVAIRNSQENGLMEESHKHYRYALSFYKQLVSGKHTLEDVQALTMICHHLRNFPKPGAAWIMTSQTYLYAIELGLHRSVKNWADGTGKLSMLNIEMRKRVFWTLNALQVNLNGKLGRPMPISNEDIDVEFPEPMNDCLPGEDVNLDRFHQCSFQVGIQIARYTALEVDLYKNIYSVRYSPDAYAERLKNVEAGIQQWKDELPKELRDPARASENDHIFTLYLEYWYQAYNLTLHHPSVCHSADPSIVNSNLDKCMDASQKMLYNCNELMQKKSLDIPWINTVVYIAAIFTTLFISSMRRENMSPADMTKLETDMTIWIDVLGECDHFLGSGDKLKSAIQKIVDQSLRNINDSIVKRTATESLARVELQSPQPSTSTSGYDASGYREQYSTVGSGPTDPALTPHSSAYVGSPASSMHPYNLGNPIPTPEHASRAFDRQVYSDSADSNLPSTHSTALPSYKGPQPSDNYAYAGSHPQPSNGAQATYTTDGFPPQEWRQWSNMFTQPQPLSQPGEYLNTASTLVALGGREGRIQNPGNDGRRSIDISAAQGHPGHTHWPEISYPGIANGHMGHQ